MSKSTRHITGLVIRSIRWTCRTSKDNRCSKSVTLFGRLELKPLKQASSLNRSREVHAPMLCYRYQSDFSGAIRDGDLAQTSFSSDQYPSPRTLYSVYNTNAGTNQTRPTTKSITLSYLATYCSTRKTVLVKNVYTAVLVYVQTSFFSCSRAARPIICWLRNVGQNKFSLSWYCGVLFVFT